MKNTVVFKNRLEVKILAVFTGAIFGALYLYTSLSDIINNSQHLWRNQLYMLIVAFVFSIPVFIVNRFRIIFDYDQKIITYVGYFSSKKRYRFDEITLHTERTGIPTLSTGYAFLSNGKKLFEFSAVEFETQTKKSAERLKLLFKDNAKFIYDIERNIKNAGYAVNIYFYSLKKVIGTVRGDCADNHYDLVFGYASEKDEFNLKVCRNALDENYCPESVVVEEQTTDFDSLENNIMHLAKKYL